MECDALGARVLALLGVGQVLLLQAGLKRGVTGIGLCGVIAGLTVHFKRRVRRRRRRKGRRGGTTPWIIEWGVTTTTPCTAPREKRPSSVACQGGRGTASIVEHHAGRPWSTGRGVVWLEVRINWRGWG